MHFVPRCSREIRPETAQSISHQVLCDCVGKTVLITFWVAVPPKTEPRKFFEFLQQQGYIRVWIDNQIVRVDADPKFKRLGARVQVIQDRITISEENRARLVEAIETALRFGKGKINVIPVSGNAQRATTNVQRPTNHGSRTHKSRITILHRLALRPLRSRHSAAYTRAVQFQ